MSGTSILSYFLLALTVGYVFTYPSFLEVNSLLGEKQKNEDSLKLIANIEIKKNELLTKFNQISATDRKSIDTVLPNSLEFVDLIAEIDSIAGTQGILLDKITSKDDDVSIGDSVADAKPAKPYRSSTVGFSFTTTYDKYNAFMSALEKSLRILDIKSMKVVSLENGLYIYTVEFQTYWLK